jgi:hypothetical protein
MATFKLTTLFQYSSAVSTPNSPLHRTGGFSESWYIDAANSGQVVTGAQLMPGQFGITGLWPARAQLLPVGTSIIGYRVQQVSPPGPSQAGAILYPGTAGIQADVPQMALLCRAQGQGVNNIRRFTLRAVPDSQVVEGEAAFAAPFLRDLQTFFQSLNGWKFRGRDLSQPSFRIVSITPLVGGGATVQCEQLPTVVVNDMVRILRTVDATKNSRGARVQITAVGPGNSVTINAWAFGACTLGSIRKDAVVFPLVDINNTGFGRVVVRRIGRPFVGFRGRRSKRR